MTRELRRLLIDGARLQDCLTLQPQERHYVERVLRLRPGARLALVDGCGRLWTALLQADGRVALEQPLDSPLEQRDAPTLTLELAMAVPRHDADGVWRMACELGVDRLQPLVAERQAPGTRLAHDRWHQIIREACEQCERLWAPVLAPVQPAGAWLASSAGSLRFLATTRQHLPELERCLSSFQGADGHLCLAVGPEGGWSGEEEAVALAAGWRPVSLGATILRTSTAAVAGLARLVAWRAGAPSCPSSPWPSRGSKPGWPHPDGGPLAGPHLA